jgi:hypothetical protein
MATYKKFNCFAENVYEGKHNFATAVIKMAFTNTAPNTSNNLLSDITEITPSGGYNAGGITLPVTSSSQTSGTYKLIVSDVTFTATGTCGPFRYIVIYDSSSDQDRLIGWYDFGSSLTLDSGNSLFLDFGGDNRLFSHS